jgi:agmatine/peptidylarginine deiminase
VVVGKYPDRYQYAPGLVGEGDYQAGKKHLDGIAEQLAGAGLEVFRMENAIPNDAIASRSDIGSAFGNYVNFLRVGNTIFMPQYGLEELDRKACEMIEHLGFSVSRIGGRIGCLADEGGVLNCVTMEY